MFTWLAVRLICRPRLNAPRFMNDGPKEFDHRALIQWPFIGFTHSLNHLALTGMIAEMHAGSSFRLAHLKRELRALVQQPEQVPVKRVYFSSPVFNAHRVTPCDVRSLPTSGSQILRRLQTTCQSLRSILESNKKAGRNLVMELAAG